MTATGGFVPSESFDYDPNNRVNWTGRMLSLKAYLEGPFNGTNMNTTLNGILPLSHPFQCYAALLREVRQNGILQVQEAWAPSRM